MALVHNTIINHELAFVAAVRHDRATAIVTVNSYFGMTKFEIK